MTKIGKKFGKLTVLEECEERKNNQKVYKCICDCGNTTYVVSGNLRLSGHTRSCGCLKHEKYALKHGKSDTKLYNIYNLIKSRCYNKHAKTYKDYGGRGIKVCDEWLNDFMTFYNWSMNNGYKAGLTIDRIDNNKCYSPDNCRWVDMKTQSNNRRSNIHLTYDGKTRTLKQWAEDLNVNYSTLWWRYKQGKSTKDILEN